MRKAYGAGLYAMCGPAFEPDACLALPSASIAVMGPQAAVNAVYYNKIQEIPEGAERDAYVAKLRDEYRADIDIMKLAASWSSTPSSRATGCATSWPRVSRTTRASASGGPTRSTSSARCER